MPYHLIDSHAHLSSQEMLSASDEVIEEAKKEGVTQIINICTDIPSLTAGLALATKQPMVKNAGATTPHDAAKEGKEAFSDFAQAAKEGKLIAIGETGLDYHYLHSPKEEQQLLFIRYMELALETHLPLIIHCRDAFDDLISLIDTHYLSDQRALPGILHCFTGSKEEAAELLKRGWYLSMSGIVTFNKSVDLQKIAASMPLENMLIETDTPYLAPTPHRGKRNSPAYLPRVADKIASLRGCSYELIAKTTTENAQRAFKGLTPHV